MLYKFIDNQGSFSVKNPSKYRCYFPLTNAAGTLLSAITPTLAGDIKRDNDTFLTPPASIEDLNSNLLCRRDFFLKTNKEMIRLSQTTKTDNLEAGILYHKLTKKIHNLKIETINFIPYNLDAEVMWVKITNLSKKTISFTPTSFIPLYGRSEKNIRDHRHVSSLLNRITLNKYSILLKPTMIFDEKGHRENQTLYYCLAYQDNLKAATGQFPTLEEFYGDGDILHPQAIERNITPTKKEKSSHQGKEACAAFCFKKTQLPPNATTQFCLIMGITENKQIIDKTFFQLNSFDKINISFENTRSYWTNYLSKIDISFNNKNLDNWLRWIKLQPTLRKLFGCSFLPHFDYGKGGRGWRDLWQDALTLLTTEPEEAKKLILHSLTGIRIDGTNATIITKNNSFLSDRNKINRVWMDHGVWPYLTLKLYLHQSGEIKLLNQELTYFCDHQLKRGQEIDKQDHDKDFVLRNKNGKIYQGSILEHILVQTLTQFFNVGEHNMTRLENADWNDGLDLAQDKGESVAFTFMYTHNLNDLCSLLQELEKHHKDISLLKEITILLDRITNPINYNNYDEKQKLLANYLEKTKQIDGEKITIKVSDLIKDLQAKINHYTTLLRKQEWLQEGFFNGYYDNKAKRVEGKINGKIRMLLTSQVFAIMSLVSTENQIKILWKSILKHLYDKKLGGFRLNTDFKSLYLDLGRAFGFSFGDKENGAVFSHMVIMLAYALYKRNFTKEGFRVLNSILKMANNSCAKNYPLIPEYFNSQGQGLYLYLTGSASWYNYTLLEQVLGLNFYYGNLHIEPKLLEENFFSKQINVNFFFANKEINLIFTLNKKKKLKCPLTIKNVTLENITLKHTSKFFALDKETILKTNAKKIKLTVEF